MNSSFSMIGWPNHFQVFPFLSSFPPTYKKFIF
jgi:hypothetical protein